MRRSKVRIYLGAPNRPAQIIIERTLDDGSLFGAVVSFLPSMKDVAETRYRDLKTFEDVGDLLREFGTEEEFAIWDAQRLLGQGEEVLKKSLPLLPKADTSVLLDANAYASVPTPPPLGAGEAPPFGSYDRIIVSFSGGKDSLACLLHLLELGVPKEKIELWHQAVDGEPGKDERFFDWPVTESYCKAVARALDIPILFQWREGGFEREMLRDRSLTAPCDFELPSGGVGRAGGERGKLSTRMKFPQLSGDLSVRWCSAYLKIDVAKRALANDPRFARSKVLLLTGERRQESANRALYAEVEEHSTSNASRRVDQWRAILDWRESDVWAIIERAQLRPHPAYFAGFSRVSCMSCIFGNPDQWATVRDLSLSTFEKIARFEREFGAFWDLPSSRQLERDMRAKAASKAAKDASKAADDEPHKEPKERPYGLPMTIHRTKTVVELANEGVSYLDNPNLSPTQRMVARRSADMAMREEYGDARHRGPWLLPSGAYRHSGGPI